MSAISVIVPVYNVAAYLEKCLDSILAQTFTDFEAWLIDDGSTDGSGAICDRYAQRDRRLRALHVENGGVSRARNLGLDRAEGTYLVFVDSDDFVAPNLLARLARAAQIDEAVDCVLFPAASVSASGARLETLGEALPAGEPLALADHRELLFAAPALWNKLYRREVVERMGLRFNPALAIGEDLAFYLDYVQGCRRFLYTGGEPLYHYVQRGSSAMQRFDAAKNRSLLDAFDQVLAHYEQQGLREAYDDELAYLAVYHLQIAALVRVLRADPRHALVTQIPAYMRQHFPDYARNPYLSRLDRNKALVFRLLQRRWYGAVRLLFRLKDCLRRD